MDRAEVGKELNELNLALVDAYASLTMLVNDEADCRARELRAQFATENITVAKAMTDANTVGQSKLVTECRNNIAALIARGDHLRFMVKYGMEAQL